MLEFIKLDIVEKEYNLITSIKNVLLFLREKNKTKQQRNKEPVQKNISAGFFFQIFQIFFFFFEEKKTPNIDTEDIQQ